MTEFAAIVFSSRDWIAPAVGFVLILSGALIWAGHRSAVENRVRIGCALLKLAGVLALALCLLEPLRVNQRAKPGANLFALMADNSQSLQIKDAGQLQSRGELLRGQLTNDATGWQAALAENFQLRRYLVDSRLQDTHDFGELNFGGHASAIGNALRTAAEQWRGQPVAGVLLFTDGNATDLSQDLAGLEGCPPVYPVVVGQDGGLRDISLEKVSVSQTAFEDAPATVQAEVAARGFVGAGVTTRLTEIATGATNVNGESHTISEQQQTANADNNNLTVRFQFQPDKPGIHFYELETRLRNESTGGAAASQEATLVNNRQILVVDRGQEPFRVLYVGGRPNWEFKFLNRALMDDPQVQMVSLIRMARRQPKFDFRGNNGEASNPLYKGFGETNEDTARYDQPVIVRINTKDEYELRGNFPKTAEELFQYHAVIVGDLEAEFFSHDQMVLLQRFVSERGGGFLMLGGAESFREGNYAGTAIASMLPVYLDQTPNVKLPGKWKWSLTREGLLEPWTRLRATESDEKTRLDSLPQFQVFNSVTGIKPGASILARVTDESNNSYPSLVVQRFGLGRTGAVLVGDLWSWGMHSEDSQKDLQKSWRQLVRWLVADVPNRVQVSAETASGGDSRVRLVVKARDEAFKPVDNANVQLTIRPVRLFQSQKGGELGGVETNFLQLTADASTTQPGTYEATYIARDAGAYAVNALVTQSDGKAVGTASAGWASDPAAAEFRSLQPNRNLMEALAKRTGGAVLKMEDLPDFARKLPERRAPVTEPWSEPLWQKPAVFLFVLACFVIEWGVRRWKGLP